MADGAIHISLLVGRAVATGSTAVTGALARGTSQFIITPALRAMGPSAVLGIGGALNTAMLSTRVNPAIGLGIYEATLSARAMRFAPVSAANRSLPILNPHFTPRQFSAAELQAMVQAEHRALLASGVSHTKMGPAMSIAQDAQTGALSFIYRNQTTLPSQLSEQIASRLSSAPAYLKAPKGPGLHAEIYAANELLLARPGATLKDLRIFTMETKIPALRGQYKPPCVQCGHLLDGAEFLR